MPDKYPTWKRVSPRLVVSEEERDGTPDFYIVKEAPLCWRVKWRTSAHWDAKVHRTAAAAMRSVDQQFHPKGADTMKIYHLGDGVYVRTNANLAGLAREIKSGDPEMQAARDYFRRCGLSEESKG